VFLSLIPLYTKKCTVVPIPFLADTGAPRMGSEAWRRSVKMNYIGCGIQINTILGKLQWNSK